MAGEKCAVEVSSVWLVSDWSNETWCPLLQLCKVSPSKHINLMKKF